MTIPLITKGCDSIYSWDPQFEHMWKKGDEHQLAQELLGVIPHRSFINPHTKKPVIVSITGGEPTLRAKFIPTLLNTEEFSDCQILLIETNCSVPLNWKFVTAMNQWLANNIKRKLIWSNSPKLSVSGEKWEEAIRPDIAMMQRAVTGNIDHGRQMEQYFKFVCGPDASDFDEVVKAMEEYYQAGVPRDAEVYIMPVACQVQDQTDIASRVAQMCMERGFIYCHRVHLDVFGNGVGT